MEIRIESVNKDNSHSWVRLSHGLNKLATDLIDKEYDDNEQETSETKSEELALKTNVFAFASRSKAKQNLEDLPLHCSSTRTVLIWWKILDWYWARNLFEHRLPSVKKTDYSSSSWSIKIEFWRLKYYLRNEFENSQHRSDEMWRSKMAGGGGQQEKDFNIVLTRQDKKFFISELFKVIQDAIPLILHYRTMC